MPLPIDLGEGKPFPISSFTPVDEDKLSSAIYIQKW
jgi:hypothetical protein